MFNGSKDEEIVQLYKLNLIPLHVVLAALVWVLHDYFVTLEDEVTYMWKPGFGKFMFFWIRYYTIFLVVFDTLQIHGFAIRGVPSLALCIAVDPTTRMAGAISLWSVEIIMQLRIYALFNRSKKVALFNGILFAISIVLFLWIMVVNAINRSKLIANVIHLALIGCPAINGGSQWAQWIPATIFELVLFGFVAYKGVVSTAAKTKLNDKSSLTAVLLYEHILYFFVAGCLLIFNNLMVVGATRIPWFGFGPFHAAIGGQNPNLPEIRSLEPVSRDPTDGAREIVDSDTIRSTTVPHDLESAPRLSLNSVGWNEPTWTLAYWHDIENPS
ncbi:hypothetical protein BDZ97DRAFT_1354981 [Flammula alnicola]|nr:hypothetical protein BDZ97DRAFT_1354981 [Flammula alnicola]